ncbi:sce7726 family protein [Emcibacter nanhaiensis]|uniref:sce7726 family protein n=1 Tax=Emcibacter nanhaiensis TaxID=1505037 RepID=UPI0015E365D1|nr:sce7726 family protein [Emcibacter nanhaiensis]
MLDADQIKVKLIDFLIDQDDCTLIASEVPFYQGYRKADLIHLANNSITAFEIKSDRDSLTKLLDQVSDYNHTFSFCYLVTTKKHLATARKLISPKTGIMLVEDSSISVVRKSKENKRLCKHSLTLALPGQDISKLTKNSRVDKALHSQRRYVESETTLQTLKKYFYEALFDKYHKNYTNFISDRGMRTTLTDLYYLQSSY